MTFRRISFGLLSSTYLVLAARMREQQCMNIVEALCLVLRTDLVLDHRHWQARVLFFFGLFVQLHHDRLQIICDLFNGRRTLFARNFEGECLEFAQIFEHKVDDDRMLFRQGNHVL